MGTLAADHGILTQNAGFPHLCHVGLGEDSHGDLGELGQVNHAFFMHLRYPMYDEFTRILPDDFEDGEA